jgi:anti-anti-sigma factor
MSEHWNIQTKDHGTVLTLLLDWDLDTSNEFLTYLEGDFKPEEHKNFIFDLHLVDHIDSMVIGIMVNISKRVKKAGGHIYLFQPSQTVVKLLTDIQLLSFFNVVQSENDLLDFCRKNSDN